MAIEYLQSRGLVHGDIRGENILVSSNGDALLSDFGLSRRRELSSSTGQKGAGSIPFQSPEVLKGASKSYESDVYAFGMTIYQVRQC